MDLRGTMVQEIPPSNAAKFPAASQVKMDGKYLYVIADHTADVLNKLASDPRIHLSVISDLPAAEVKQVLQAIPSQKDGTSTLADRIDKVGTYDDFKKWGYDKDRTLVMSGEHWAPDLPAHVAKLAPTFYEFPSYDDAQKSLDALKQKDAKEFAKKKEFFPSDETTFNQHKDRMLGVYGYVMQAVEGVTPKHSLNDSLSNPALTDLDKDIAYGKAEVSRVFRWVIQKGIVKGCAETDSDGKSHSVPRPMDFCEGNLPNHLAWRGSGKSVSCVRLTVTNELISTAPTSDCAANLPVHYLWTNPQNDQCALFTDDLKYVATADDSKCTMPIVCNKGGLQIFSKSDPTTFLFKAVKNLDEAYKEMDPAASLQRNSSFAHLFLDDTVNAKFAAVIPAQCFNAMKKVYASGHTLYSQKLHDAGTKVLDWTYKDGKKSEADFYHWTNSPETPALAQAGDYDGIFRYLRTRGGDYWLQVWYAAQDPASSKSYGSNEVAIKFSPKALVINFLDPKWKDAIDELNTRYPDVVSGCNLHPPTSYVDFQHEPLFLIGEDSGIDLIDYYGLGTVYPHIYFQILSPANIIGYKPEK